MGLSRIVRKNLQKTGQAARVYHRKDRVPVMRDGQPGLRKKTCWLDLRPRDEQGNLQKAGE